MRPPPGNPPTPAERWQLARRLFETACQRPAVEREAFLDEACARDARLRADVERLLQLDQASGLPLEPPSAERMSAALAGDLDVERPGSRLGAYVLERRLGSGGMGSVWLAARADRQFEKRVALKVVKRGMDSEDVLRRFAVERQLLADLDHPGVTRLLDGGLTSDGRPYLVMEQVEGEPIDRWCDARCLPVRERVELFRRVCETVDYAHRRGIVHRDLKPGNVMVTADGSPKLLDFGIAKILDPEKAVDLTLAEHRPLTPGYASPEQVQGRAVTPATDVYSLGVMLYELLTGRRPYPVHTTSLVELERAICEREPPRPSTTVGTAIRAQDLPHGEQEPTPVDLGARRASDPRRLRAQLEGDLDNIVLKALAKEPERRYADAGELSADLARMLHGLPVLARPASWSYRARKFVRRNRLLVGSATTVFLALTLGLVGSLWFWNREVDQRRATEAREYASRIAAASMALRAHDVVDARRHLELAPERLRGWEWRHFMQRTDRSERTFVGGVGPLLACAFSPDGKLLAAAGDGRVVIVWELESGREVARWDGHPRSIRTLAFRPDGERLLAACIRGRVAEWSWAEDRVVREWSDHPGGFDTAVYSPSGDRVAAGGFDGTVLVLDAQTGETLARLVRHDDVVTGLDFHPDGDRLVSASRDGTFCLWDLAAGGALLQRCEYGDPPAEVAFLHGGARFATGNYRGMLSFWDGTSSEPLRQRAAHGKNIWTLDLAPDGRLLATASADGTVGLWDAATAERRAVLLGHQDIVQSVAFHPSLPLLASCSADGTVRIWRSDVDDVPSLGGEPGWFTGLSMARAGTLLVESGDQAVGLWCWQDGAFRLLERWDLGPAVVDCTNAIALDPQGRRVAYSSCASEIEVVDARTGQVLYRLPRQGKVADVLRFSPEGDLIALGTTSGEVSLWRATDGAEVWSVPGDGRWAHDLEFSSDGRRVLYGTPGGTVRILDVHAGGELLRLEVPPKVWGVAFHPDGTRFATACVDSTVRTFSADTGEPLAVLRGHSRQAFCVDYSPDGTRLASGALDCTVRLWDTRTGEEVAVLYGHLERVDDVEFSADGRQIVSKSIDGEVRIWEARMPSGGGAPQPAPIDPAELESL